MFTHTVLLSKPGPGKQTGIPSIRLRVCRWDHTIELQRGTDMEAEGKLLLLNKALCPHLGASAVATASLRVPVYRAVNGVHFSALWDLRQVT